ncbi:MAG: hypothetical protein J6Q13_00830 [Clostridia bacterium]|nr:hypothetical protein [Clostridia bacterium]
MSNFEIFLIVGFCVAPLLAILFVLPKKLKKEKKQEKKEVKTLEQLKKEEQPKPVVEEKVDEKKVQQKFTPKSEVSTDDFKSYLDFKKKDITKPSRVELPKDFMDRTSPYIPRRRRRIEKKPKTVAEEINSLSPKLKAMLFSGVLDRKFFDN